MLKKLAPTKRLKRLVTEDITVNKAALSMVSEADFISKSKITLTALAVVRTYKKQIKDKERTKRDVLADKKLMVARVQNAIVLQVSQEIKDVYRGESYKWLPSDAAEPDPEHQLNYGKVFQIGEGEMPGERYGCRCSLEILVKETKLNL